MIKKKITRPREEMYREIMAKAGIPWDECTLLAFAFADKSLSAQFHYALMSPPYVFYCLFDRWDTFAAVITDANQEHASIITERAARLGGRPVTSILRVQS